MKDDITPVNLGTFVQVNQPKHTNSPDCPACRKTDREERNKRRGSAKIHELERKLEGLGAHCRHPQTKTIRMERYIEGEFGLTLEGEDVEQCLGCAAILWWRNAL